MNERHKQSPEQVRILFDALVGRLSYDEEFRAEVMNNPRETLGKAGLLLDRASVEEFVKVNPRVFDSIGDALLRNVKGDFFARIGAMASTCG